MKKIVLIAAAISMVLATTLSAQQAKVDVEGFKKKIVKSDTDIADPKKNVKAATWMDRGKLFYDVAEAPTKSIFAGAEEIMVTSLFGKPLEAPVVEKIGEEEFTVAKHTTLIIYYKKDQTGINKVAAWQSNIEITEDPVGKSLQAYMKAYSIDPNTKEKVVEAQTKISNLVKQEAQNSYALGKYEDTAESFARQYDILRGTPASVIDTSSTYYAGMLYTVNGNLDKGITYLKHALDNEYYAEGDVYYYLFHCYIGKKDTVSAKAILSDGLVKFTSNTRIVEALIHLYTSGSGNVEEIIPIVNKAIESDPKNPVLYKGAGMIYDKLGKFDKAVESFVKADELTPNDYGINYAIGFLYAKWGDEMNKVVNNSKYSPAEYTARQDEVNKVYMKALPNLEKALTLADDKTGVLEMLKNLTLRLQEEPGIMEKYEKYNKMLKELTDK